VGRYQCKSRGKRFLLGKIAILRKAKVEAADMLKEGATLFHDRTVEDLREQELEHEQSDYADMYSSSDSETDN